mgnify:CR=1 FL=1
MRVQFLALTPDRLRVRRISQLRHAAPVYGIISLKTKTLIKLVNVDRPMNHFVFVHQKLLDVPF